MSPEIKDQRCDPTPPPLNSALCLRFDLDTFSTRHAYIADVGWGCYAHLARLLQVASAFGVRFQFCACGQGVEEYPLEVRQILERGHRVDSHLYSHRVVLTDPAPRVAEELVLTERVFARHGIPWTGIGATGMYPRGISDCPETIELLSERGYGWCSSHYNAGMPLEKMQPYWLNEFVLEIPGSGFSDRNWFRNDKATVNGFIEQSTTLIRQAKQQGLVYTIDLHPGVLAKWDPACDYVCALCRCAADLDVPLVTMDAILHWRETMREVKRFAAGERPGSRAAWWQECGWLPAEPPDRPPTLRRLLDALQAWEEHGAQPLHQPEKVMDYIGGWRCRPNSRRPGVTINRFGLRGDDLLRTRLRGETRVLCIGDSCVFGCAPDEAPWPSQLQQRLNEMAPLAFQVLNAGVNGQRAQQGVLRLPQLLRQLEPDIVLIAYLANDAWCARECLSSGCEPADFAAQLRDMIDYCRAHGARPMLITPPGIVPRDAPMTAYMLAVMHQPTWLGDEKQPQAMRQLYDLHHQAIRLLAGDMGVICLDVAAEFDTTLDRRRDHLFSDTCHMLPEGYAEMGRMIAAGLLASQEGGNA